jgi:glutathione synthase/RimK-type ligase-like ATP-grasp enzyme
VTERERPVVLVGAEDDDHLAALREALRARGEVPVVLDSLRFPEQPRISMGRELEDVRMDGLPLGRPGAVYLRGLYLSPIAYLVDVEREMAENWRKMLVVFREKGEFLLGLVRRWEFLEVPIYNTLVASERTRKPFQIALLAAAGLPVPETLWTNDAAEVPVFAEGRRVAYKPVSGGAATKELGEQDFEPARLARVANCPVTFQQLVPGEDLRVFVLDGRPLAAFRIEVEEGALDYRQNEQRIESVPLSPDLAELARRATEVIGLRFTGMDLKRASDGSWRILELNPSPMFLGFDQRAGTDILGALADALVRAARQRA